MNNNVIMYILTGSIALFLVVIIAYLAIRKKMNTSEARQIQKLREGTEAKSFSTELLFQKLYIFYLRTPFLKKYLLKVRRRIEIINVDDEYLTRKQSAAILTKTLGIIIPLTIAIVALTYSNTLLLVILLLFELFMVDTFMDGMVNKLDNKLLKEQIEFFSEIRHAYHEFNMVEEAIYQVAQDDEKPEMSRQAEKIYEVLISDDPESELEKYYDIAPNSYLKEFAGISYLTKEFGDRKIDKTSLYLKNLNNITQEMQLEILKRDKLDYTFQSLSVISIVPILMLQPLKSWAVSQFSFTSSFYNGKTGFIIQILIILLTFVCYLLIGKLKDNGSTAMNTKNTENPWQEKLYRLSLVKKIIDMLMPKEGTKEDRKLTKKMKDAASKDKKQWIYINRVLVCIITFAASIFIFNYIHGIVIKGVYEDPTQDYNVIGQMSSRDEERAMKLTESDNKYLEYFKGKPDTEQEEIEYVMKQGRVNQDYIESTDEEISTAADRVLTKLKIVSSETLQWFEVLMALVFAIAAYMTPIWMLTFQAKMRQLEMEDEVMQFNTIILMLMKIERVNVEIILEWLERYANIFKEPISRCVNDYESGAWEALEQLKDDVTYQPFIRIVESLQAAVEKIPIEDAFDELDTEREYYQEKRKESNERLIARKGRIGKVIGFAPMIVLFVGYLIVPLVVIGLSSMTGTMNSINTNATT
mgnify:CR=1 FL=1